MRGFGDLEAVVMDRFWSRGGPATAREVLDELRASRPLAYNTVQTVVDHLFRKGWLTRQRVGRAFRYAPVVSREEYGAQLMRAGLDDGGDPRQVFVSFVRQMSPAEAAALRAVLDAHDDGHVAGAGS